MERQQGYRVHYEDLLSSEDEDISASSGSDQEYRPHHPRGPHTLTRKVKGGRKDHTSVSLRKGLFGWAAEELLEEVEEEEREEKQKEREEKKTEREVFFPCTTESDRENCARLNQGFSDVDEGEYEWKGVSISSPHHHHHQMYSINTTTSHHHHQQQQQQQQPHINTTTLHHHPNTTIPQHHHQHQQHYSISTTMPHHLHHHQHQCSIKATLPHHSHHPCHYHPSLNTLPSQADKGGAKVKGADTQKGRKDIKGGESTHISHTDKGEEPTHSTNQTHRGERSTHRQTTEERDAHGQTEEASHRYTHDHIKERQRCAHNTMTGKNPKRTHTNTPQDQDASPHHTKRKTKTTSTTKGKSYERVWSPWKVWSLPNMLTLLLTLLYLGVLITRQDVLLLDILRWCRSGHIPFLLAHLTVNRVLRSYVPRCPIYLKVPRVPTSSAIRKATCQMSLLLSLQAVPFPPAGSIIRRLVAVLRLPEETSTMAEEVVALRRLTQQRQEAACEGLAKGEAPGVECQAAAALLVTLKMCCGLNDSSEHHLSVVAARVNGAMMGGSGLHPPVSPLFSFDEWMRYIVEVAWLSKQVDPLCEAITPPPVLARPSETKLMADLACLLTFCSAEPVVSIPDLENYPNMRRQLEALGLSLERLCQAHFTGSSAPHEPLLGTLEKYLDWHHSSSSSTSHRHQQEASPRLLRRAQQLLQTTFSSTQLLWTHRLSHIQQQLREHGSSIRLKSVKYPHSLCPLPLKLPEGRKHQGEVWGNTYHWGRKHTHSLVAGNTQKEAQWRGMWGESDEEEHKVDTAAPFNSHPSRVAAWLRSTPAGGVCGDRQHRQGSLATLGEDSCFINTQKFCLRDGEMCEGKNLRGLGKEEWYRRCWCCIHTQNMCSGDEKRCNLKNTKEVCVEEKYEKCSCHICTQNLPSDDGKTCDLNTKEPSQEEQHRKGCYHTHTQKLSCQNRSIYRSKSTDERHYRPMPAEVCRYKEEERIISENVEWLSSDDIVAHINKRDRDTGSPGFLEGSYSPSENSIDCVPEDMHSNQMKEEDTGFSLHAGKQGNRTQKEGEDTSFSFLYVPEDSRSPGKIKSTCSTLCATEDKRRVREKSTDKSTSFVYVPEDHNHTHRMGKDALCSTLYPTEKEDASQRSNRGTSSITSHPPEGKTGSQRKEQDTHPTTSHTPEDEDRSRDEDDDTSSTSCISSNSSVLAHESLDRLLRGGTLATVLSHTLFVPVPAYRVWQGPDVTKAKWKQVWNGLPRSYRCVVEVFVALCGVTRRELLKEAQAMEKVVEIYSSLLFLFPDPP